MEMNILVETATSSVLPNRQVGLRLVEPSSCSAHIEQNDALAFLRSLPDESVDVITTDPAYSGMNQYLKLGSGRIVGDYSAKGLDESKWFEEFHDTEENYLQFLGECQRVLKQNRHIYIMFDSYSMLTLAPLIRRFFDVKNIICWDKVNIGMGHYYRRRHEFIVFASKGKRPVSAKNIPDVWRFKRIVNPTYPTQKPVEVFEAMLLASAQPGFAVCDPFVGSGSAAIAAIKRSCNFIGCDRSNRAVALATDRVQTYQTTQLDIMQKKSSLVSDEDVRWFK